jgi:hypothetical protein
MGVSVGGSVGVWVGKKRGVTVGKGEAVDEGSGVTVAVDVGVTTRLNPPHAMRNRAKADIPIKNLLVIASRDCCGEAISP